MRLAQTVLMGAAFFVAACTSTTEVQTAYCPPLKPGPRSDLIERSGCCSHHNGVCGCSMGRAMCCDGQPSPSCGCD